MSNEDLDSTIVHDDDAGPGAGEDSNEMPTVQATAVTQFTRGTQAYNPSADGPKAPGHKAKKTSLSAGTVLDGRYRLDAVIGSGAMGEVWRAHHLGLDATVAVKLIANDVEASDTAIDRFYREARTMARLSHPNVIRVLDVSLPDAEVPYIAMEMLEGETLRQRMRREPTFHLDAAREVLAQMLGALGAAHHNDVVHRDLKPANIFLVEDRSTPLGFRVKVLDFGTALLLDAGDKRLTQEGVIIGTPYYMAPEQAIGKVPTSACDLYAAAVIFYELLSGHVPHEVDDFRALLTRRSTQEPESIRVLVPKLPGPYDPFFSKALAINPEERYASAVEMRFALAGLPTADGQIVNFDDASFQAALEGALQNADTQTGAHPARALARQAESEALEHGLDEAVAAGPQVFGGELRDDLPPKEEIQLADTGAAVGLDLDGLEDGDLKRELVARQAKEDGTDEAGAKASDSGSATRHVVALVAAVASAVGVWFASGGDPKFETFATTPALLSSLIGIAAFVGVNVAMTPVNKAEAPEEEPSNEA